MPNYRNVPIPWDVNSPFDTVMNRWMELNARDGISNAEQGRRLIAADVKARESPGKAEAEDVGALRREVERLSREVARLQRGVVAVQAEEKPQAADEARQKAQSGIKKLGSKFLE